jgi:peptide/nickel transport system substrate-binding protein
LTFRRTALVFIIIIAILSVLAGCVPETDKPGEQQQIDTTPVKGGRFSFAAIEPETLNPILNDERDAYHFLKLVFESLVDYDKELRITPVLAKDWNISGNGNTVTINLREGVKWHDGEDFTSTDVVFTIEYLKSLKGEDSAYLTNIDRLTYYEALDSHSVKVVFDQGFNGIFDILTFPVLPSHLYTSAQSFADGKDDFKPIGTGPYVVGEYQKLKSLALQVNSDWWGQMPYIEGIDVLFVPDGDTALTSFKAGQIDAVLTTFPDWESYREEGKAYIKEFVTNKYDFIGLNFNKPAFRNKELRQAIQYGIDRDRIIEKVYLKHGTVVDVPIPTFSWLFSQGAKPEYQYDPDSAKEALDDGGWMDRDGDGILEKEIDGVKTDISFTLLVNSDNPKRLEAARMIIENLTSLGMKVNLVEDNWDKVIDRVYKKQFDAVLLGWNLANYLDLSFAFHSNQIDGGSNFVSYQDQEMDNLLQDDFRAIEQTKRLETSSKVQQYIRENLPYNSLYFKNAALLVKNKIQGEIEPRDHNIFLNINKWYIPESMQ